MGMGEGEMAPCVGRYVEVRSLVAAHPSSHLVSVLVCIVPQAYGEDIVDVEGQVVLAGVAHLCRHGVDVHLHGEVVREKVFHLLVIGIIGQSGTVASQPERIHAVAVRTDVAIAILLLEHHLHAFNSRSRAVGYAPAHHAGGIGEAVSLHRRSRDDVPLVVFRHDLHAIFVVSAAEGGIVVVAVVGAVARRGIDVSPSLVVVVGGAERPSSYGEARFVDPHLLDGPR